MVCDKANFQCNIHLAYAVNQNKKMSKIIANSNVTLNSLLLKQASNRIYYYWSVALGLDWIKLLFAFSNTS